MGGRVSKRHLCHWEIRPEEDFPHPANQSTYRSKTPVIGGLLKRISPVRDLRPTALIGLLNRSLRMGRTLHFKTSVHRQDVSTRSSQTISFLRTGTVLRIFLTSG